MRLAPGPKLEMARGLNAIRPWASGPGRIHSHTNTLAWEHTIPPPLHTHTHINTYTLVCVRTNPTYALHLAHPHWHPHACTLTITPILTHIHAHAYSDSHLHPPDHTLTLSDPLAFILTPASSHNLSSIPTLSFTQANSPLPIHTYTLIPINSYNHTYTLHTDF